MSTPSKMEFLLDRDEEVSDQDGAAGFTLVEVIAALAILSLTMAVVFGAFSAGFFNQRKARDLAEATSLAQSTLARVGAEWPIIPGRFAGGTEAEYRWNVVIEPYPFAPTHDLGPIRPYRIVVSISVDAKRDPLVTLTTIRLSGQGTPR
jgi:general secretion pathway protein I